MKASYVIRDVADPWAFRALEDVQVAAWSYPDREVTPGTLLRISAVTGGIVLGAYPAGKETVSGETAKGQMGVPVGLAFGFPALRNGEVWHHSHLLAVREGWRGTGLAVALKLAQRERALAQGIKRMTWTFDPLVARNARLNLGKLGARAVSYHADWYALEDDPERALPADRLMVAWNLTLPHAEHPAPAPEGEMVLVATAQEPGQPQLNRSGPRLLVEVPTRTDAWSEATRRAWRLALREALGTYLARGYAVTDLARAGERAFYVLSREG